MAIFSQEKNYFGIDIGSTAIRLVQLRGSGGRPALVTYADIKVDHGVTTSDAAADRSKVAALIKQLVRDAKVNTKNVVAGVPSNNIYASVITTPKLGHAELAKAIKYQADQYIPMAIDQVKYDWSVLEESADGKQMDVLLVAAPNSVTNRYLEIFEQAGLDILAVEANALATARALVPNNLPTIILDIGSINTDITLVYNGSPRLLRSVTVGGNTFVKAVSQTLNLDEAQAEQFTYKFGLTQTKLEGQVYKAIKPSLDVLVEEIDKSSKFFATKYSGVKLEKIILTGGTAALPELMPYLATASGLPVEIGNSWINISYPAGLQDKLLGVSTQYSVAAGLAQRNFV